MSLVHQQKLAARLRASHPELTDEFIGSLNKWADEHQLPEIPVEQLAVFGHSCFWDLEATAKCMEVYYRQRATIPEFFADRDPCAEYIQFSLKALQFVHLPKPDKEGSRVIFHRLADTTPRNYMFNDGIKLLLMTLDASLRAVMIDSNDNDNGKSGSGRCAPGYVFLFDMQGVRIGHLTRLSMGSIRHFFEYLQEGLPVRLKSIHVLNAVWFMDKVLGLIRPFMKKELFDMLHLYTGDVSEIYEHIAPDCLPKDYGGELEDLKTLHEKHCETLLEERDYFIEEEKLYRSYKPTSAKSSS